MPATTYDLRPTHSGRALISTSTTSTNVPGRYTIGDPDTLVAAWEASGLVVATGRPYRIP